MDPLAVRTRRTTALPMVVFPEPLSPTSPRPQGPGGSRRLTPSTARTGPNRTASSLMSSNGVTGRDPYELLAGRATGRPASRSPGAGVTGLAASGSPGVRVTGLAASGSPGAGLTGLPP